MKRIITLKSSKSKSLNGIIEVPGDKSISQRALIFSSICIGNSKIFGILKSEDVLNTLNSLKTLGIKISKKNSFYEVEGNGGIFSSPRKVLDFGNSGTGVRLMMGLLSTKNINATFTGDNSLTKRPMLRIIDPLKLMGAKFEHSDGKLPVNLLKSKITFPINYDLKIGSAQIKSAILLASLNLKGTTVIKELIRSRDHTEIMLKDLGAQIYVDKKNRKISITGPNNLIPKDLHIPGDFSSASFIIVAAILCPKSKLVIKSVGLNYYRTGLIDVIKKMGGKLKILKKWKKNGELVGDIEVQSSELIGVKVSKDISPRLIDEYPILFVAASFAKGSTHFSGLKELKFKESNRLDAMAKALVKCGVKVDLQSESITIHGDKKQPGGKLIDTFEDHRIAMSMIIFGLSSKKSITIDNMKMIETSFPNFFEILKKIGARIERI